MYCSYMPSQWTTPYLRWAAGEKMWHLPAGMMFLTRLPCPGWCDHHPGYLMRDMAWLPLIDGAVVGLGAASIYDAAASLWPSLVAAAVSSGGTLWLTGCFHEVSNGDVAHRDLVSQPLSATVPTSTVTVHASTRTASAERSAASAAGGPRRRSSGSCATRATARTPPWAAGCLWVVAKCAALARVGGLAPGGASRWAVGASVGAGPALAVAQCVARASAAPLIYACDYGGHTVGAFGGYS